MSGTANIISESTNYHIGSNTCRYLLLEILLQKDIIYTRATAYKIRDNLSSLYTYITRVKSDIEEFNEYSKINYEALIARGEGCNDRISKLLKEYTETGYEEFLRYTQHQKDNYNYG